MIVTIDPKYDSNHWVYLYSAKKMIYLYPDSDSGVLVDRYLLNRFMGCKCLDMQEFTKWQLYHEFIY